MEGLEGRLSETLQNIDAFENKRRYSTNSQNDLFSNVVQENTFQTPDIQTNNFNYEFTTNDSKDLMQPLSQSSSEMDSLLLPNENVYQTLQPVQVFDFPTSSEPKVYQQLQSLTQKNLSMSFEHEFSTPQRLTSVSSTEINSSFRDQKGYTYLEPVSTSTPAMQTEIKHQKNVKPLTHQEKKTFPQLIPVGSTRNQLMPVGSTCNQLPVGSSNPMPRGVSPKINPVSNNYEPPVTTSKLYQHLCRPLIKPSKISMQSSSQIASVNSTRANETELLDTQKGSLSGSMLSYQSQDSQREKPANHPLPQLTINMDMNSHFKMPTVVSTKNGNSTKTEVLKGFPEHKPKVYLELREPNARKEPKVNIQPTSSTLGYPPNFDQNLLVPGQNSGVTLNRSPIKSSLNELRSEQETFNSSNSVKLPLTKVAGAKSISKSNMETFLNTSTLAQQSTGNNSFMFIKPSIPSVKPSINSLSLPKRPVCFGDSSLNNTSRHSQVESRNDLIPNRFGVGVNKTHNLSVVAKVPSASIEALRPNFEQSTLSDSSLFVPKTIATHKVLFNSSEGLEMTQIRSNASIVPNHKENNKKPNMLLLPEPPMSDYPPSNQIPHKTNFSYPVSKNLEQSDFDSCFENFPNANWSSEDSAEKNVESAKKIGLKEGKFSSDLSKSDSDAQLKNEILLGETSVNTFANLDECQNSPPSLKGFSNINTSNIDQKNVLAIDKTKIICSKPLTKDENNQSGCVKENVKNLEDLKSLNVAKSELSSERNTSVEELVHANVQIPIQEELIESPKNDASYLSEKGFGGMGPVSKDSKPILPNSEVNKNKLWRNKQATKALLKQRYQKNQLNRQKNDQIRYVKDNSKNIGDQTSGPTIRQNELSIEKSMGTKDSLHLSVQSISTQIELDQNTEQKVSMSSENAVMEVEPSTKETKLIGSNSEVENKLWRNMQATEALKLKYKRKHKINKPMLVGKRYGNGVQTILEEEKFGKNTLSFRSKLNRNMKPHKGRRYIILDKNNISESNETSQSQIILKTDQVKNNLSTNQNQLMKPIKSSLAEHSFKQNTTLKTPVILLTDIAEDSKSKLLKQSSEDLKTKPDAETFNNKPVNKIKNDEDFLKKSYKSAQKWKPHKARRYLINSSTPSSNVEATFPSESIVNIKKKRGRPRKILSCSKDRFVKKEINVKTVIKPHKARKYAFTLVNKDIGMRRYQKENNDTIERSSLGQMVVKNKTDDESNMPSRKSTRQIKRKNFYLPHEEIMQIKRRNHKRNHKRLGRPPKSTVLEAKIKEEEHIEHKRPYKRLGRPPKSTVFKPESKVAEELIEHKRPHKRLGRPPKSTAFEDEFKEEEELTEHKRPHKRLGRPPKSTIFEADFKEEVELTEHKRPHKRLGRPPKSTVFESGFREDELVEHKRRKKRLGRPPKSTFFKAEFKEEGRLAEYKRAQKRLGRPPKSTVFRAEFEEEEELTDPLMAGLISDDDDELFLGFVDDSTDEDVGSNTSSTKNNAISNTNSDCMTVECDPETLLQAASNTLECPQCDLVADSEAELVRHIQSHVDSPSTSSSATKVGKRFSCPLCHKLYSTSAYVKKHVETIHKQSADTTGISSEIPPSEELPTCETKANSSLFQCDKCSKCFERLANLNRHKQSHVEDNVLFPCAYCDEKFPTKDLLRCHWSSHMDTNTFVCEVCNEKFSTAEALKTHKVLHEKVKPFHCEICQQSFSMLSTLRIHLLDHSGSKRFECKVCFKKYSRQDTLTLHQRVHTGEKNFECDICQQKFRWRHAVKSHKLIYHSSSKPYQCEICKKQFSHPNSFKKHAEVHSEKLHYCEICLKPFARLNTLKTHLLIHTDLKKFVCNICNKAFRIKGHLRSHLLVHSSEKPSKCQYCSKSFKNNFQLRRHNQLVHCEEIYEKLMPKLPDDENTALENSMDLSEEEVGYNPNKSGKEVEMGNLEEDANQSSDHFILSHIEGPQTKESVLSPSVF